VKNYIHKDWLSTFEKTGLLDFESIWSLEKNWFEPPNARRDGWSGVSCVKVKVSDQEYKNIFIKRQENHFSKTLFHPFQGRLTYAKESRNLFRFKKRGIPSLDLLYFAQRKVGKRRQAILITEELTNFYSLEKWIVKWYKAGWHDWAVRRKVTQAIASVTRYMHLSRIQHNCYYPKHIFIKILDDEIDIRIIDLEKAKKFFFKKTAILRDLDTLNRRTLFVSRIDRLRFFLFYMQLTALTSHTKHMCQKIYEKSKKKSSNRIS